jgi:hypothetical protein
VVTETERIEQGWPIVSSRGGAIIKSKSLSARDTLSKVAAIFRVVAMQNEESWPDDEAWSQLLPSDFVEFTQSHTDDAILNDENLCSWEGWLDALRSRDWEWLGSSCGSDELAIQIQLNNWPYNPGPLIYALWYAGASQIELNELD